MKLATYRSLQVMAGALCAVSTWTFAQAVPKLGMADTLLAVGWGDWGVTALVSLSFGMVSLLQRFKSAEAGTAYGLFIAAHMSGSLTSGVIVYLLSQGAFDSPNRFVQALAIGAAGWGGSTVADKVAAKINKATIEKAGA
jgi:hypothetical protein